MLIELRYSPQSKILDWFLHNLAIVAGKITISHVTQDTEKGLE